MQIIRRSLHMPSYMHVVTTPDASEDKYCVCYPNIISTLYYCQAVRNTSRYRRTTCYLGHAIWINNVFLEIVYKKGSFIPLGIKFLLPKGILLCSYPEAVAW